MNPNRLTLDDTSKMPFGKYKYEMLVNVPADYLLWLYEQDWLKSKYSALYRYIEENEDLLLDERDNNTT